MVANFEKILTGTCAKHVVKCTRRAYDVVKIDTIVFEIVGKGMVGGGGVGVKIPPESLAL